MKPRNQDLLVFPFPHVNTHTAYRTIVCFTFEMENILVQIAYVVDEEIQCIRSGVSLNFVFLLYFEIILDLPFHLEVKPFPGPHAGRCRHTVYKSSLPSTRECGISHFL